MEIAAATEGSAPVAKTGALIVGAGPTGLTLACELARRGAPFRIVAAAGGPSTTAKAGQLHSRTLEVLEDMGALEGAEELGVRVYGMTVYAEGRRVLHSGHDDLDAPYPYELACGQDRIERLLLDLLSRLGSRVEWHSRLETIAPDGGGALATLAGAHGASRRIRARWVIGCDGARSTVRELTGGRLERAACPEEWLVGEVRLDWQQPPDEQYAFLSEEGGFAALTCQPLPQERWRLTASLPPAHRTPGHREPDPSLAGLRELFERTGATAGRLSDLSGVTIHRVARRTVERRVAGPLILAGDAAHLTSPLGGVGMNNGIQDAHNLGWKLALALEGVAGPELIDSYAAERQAIVRRPLSTSNRSHVLRSLRRPLAGELRGRLPGFLAHFDHITDRSYRDQAQISSGYRDSPIVGEEAGAPLPRAGPSDHGSQLAAWTSFARGPRAGDRAPDSPEIREGDGGPRRLFEVLAGSEHALLMFLGCEQPHAQTLATATAIARRVGDGYGSRVTAHLVVPAGRPVAGYDWPGPVILDPTEALHNRYGARGECLVLIRPDGYIGFRAQPPSFQALSRHLSGIFAPMAIVSS
ncbi:MAG: hypothetical protein GEU88_09630 [Solirubrobacterales bacterium]|nr:hypothetical protein [Solirubrobacterales bacterium]